MSANPRPVAERFMAALQAFEADGRPDPLVKLFADDAELHNLAHAERGRDGARRFWEEYRRAFAAVRSEFTAVTVGERGAALEWESAGSLPDGSPVRYRGVSVLEVDGDRIRGFRAYYDSAAFVAPPATKTA